MNKQNVATEATQDTYNPNQTLEIALRYLKAGYVPIPVTFRGKKPLFNEWQNAVIDEANLAEHFSRNELNVGILLGSQSGDIADVDIDNDLALALSSQFLPDTKMVFGRASSRQSHRIYKCPIPKPKQFRDENNSVIVEIRGNGQHTVFPGSIHSSGEAIAFDRDGEPTSADYEHLEQACIQLSVATIISRYWVKGVRHELALAIAGLLAKNNWKFEDAEKLVAVVAAEAGDEELSDRRMAVTTTFQDHLNGRPISGYNKLSEIVGAKAADKLLSLARSSDDAALTVALPTAMAGMPDISTDLRAADMFSSSYKGRIIYSESDKTWFRKDKQVYLPIGEVRMQGVAMSFARDLAKQIGGRLPGGMAPTRNLESGRGINSLVSLSRDALNVDKRVIDTARNLVGFGDGTVFDLNTMATAVNSKYFVTKTIGPAYDPEARCPHWESFLDRIFEGDRDVVSFVQRAVGYTLSGDVGEQCLFLLVGSGANGKSTFINALNQLFGDYAAAIPMHSLMQQKGGNERTDDLALLPGKRFVAASEGEAGQRLAESRIKMMTGGDTIICRALYVNYGSFDPQYKLWLATNNLPNVRGVDTAIWRRIRVIRFPVTIPVEERNPDLGYVLQNELPGILNWALRGHRDWKQNRLGPPHKVISATAAYRFDNDKVGQFIDVCCDLSPRMVTTAKELYDRYEMWADQSGIEPMHKGTFGKTLAQKGFGQVQKKTGSAWRGLGLKPSA
jgi:putative DNA primase/helicase